MGFGVGDWVFSYLFKKPSPEPEQPRNFEINLCLFVFSTLFSFLSVHTNILEKLVMKYLNNQTGEEKDLTHQRLELKNEQRSISMVDEFAKYAKLQRRINLVDEKLKHIIRSKPANSFLIQIGFSYGLKVFFGLLFIFFSLYFRSTPVLYLGDKFSLSPFTSLICYPNDTNYVSFYFWVMCSAAVAKVFMDKEIFKL